MRATVVLRALKSVDRKWGACHIGPTLCHRGGGAATARVQDAARRASAGRYSQLQLGGPDAMPIARQRGLEYAWRGGAMPAGQNCDRLRGAALRHGLDQPDRLPDAVVQAPARARWYESAWSRSTATF